MHFLNVWEIYLSFQKNFSWFAKLPKNIYFVNHINVFNILFFKKRYYNKIKLIAIRTKPYKGGQTAKVIGKYLAEQADF